MGRDNRLKVVVGLASVFLVGLLWLPADKMHSSIPFRRSSLNRAHSREARVLQIQQYNDLDCPPHYPQKAIRNPERINLCQTKDRLRCKDSSNCSCYQKNMEEAAPFTAEYFDETRIAARTKLLEEHLSRIVVPEGHPRIVTTVVVNLGFLWLFLNWACSVTANGLNFNSLLLLALDEEAYIELRKLGFNVMQYQTYYALTDRAWQITSRGASGYAGGHWAPINAVKICFAGDLLRIGWSVLVMDADLIWRRNPLEYLAKQDHFDIQTSHDARMDMYGPVNTGFLYFRSTCKMRVFLDTYAAMVWAALSVLEQSAFNALLMNTNFRALSVHFLPESLFIGGHQFHKPEMHVSKQDPAQYYTMHASWVPSWDHKIKKFNSTGNWYFIPQCGKFYLRHFDPTQGFRPDPKSKERKKERASQKKKKKKDKKE